MIKKLLFCGCLLALIVTQSVFAQLPTTFTKIYFFGDSLTDMGNFNVGLSYPDYAAQPAPVTNWQWSEQQHTYLPSKTWAEYLAENFHNASGAVLHANPATLKNPSGDDWAVAGATSQYPDPVIHTNVKDEVNDFIKYVKQGHNPGDPEKTLYVIWVGANDLLKLQTQPDPTPTWVMQNIVLPGTESIGTMILQLAQNANAKNFLIIGLPDISLTPLFSNPNHPAIPSQYKNRAQMHQLCNTWNEFLFAPVDNPIPGVPKGELPEPPLLAVALLDKDQLHKNLNIYTFDFLPEHSNDALHQIVNDPEKFGFPATIAVTNPEAVCGNKVCNNNQLEWYFAAFTKLYGEQFPETKANDFIFHNAIHPSTHAHKVMADFVKNNSTLFQPAI